MTTEILLDLDLISILGEKLFFVFPEPFGFIFFVGIIILVGFIQPEIEDPEDDDDDDDEEEDDEEIFPPVARFPTKKKK